MKIKLNKEQLEYIYNLAKKRHDAKHQSFRNASQIMPEDKRDSFNSVYNIDKQYMPHFLGLVGEYAWSQHTGEAVDEEIYDVRDGGEDFDGVEVKTITYMGKGEPELKITQKEYEERKVPNLYVLTRFDIKNTEVELLGTISRESFDDIKVEKQYGSHLPKNYVVPVSKMKEI